MHHHEKLSVRENIARKNIFILLPEALIDNLSLQAYLKDSPYKMIEIDVLLRVLAEVVKETPANWDPIIPNLELLLAGDEAEINRLMIGVSRRKFQMKTALQNEVRFITQDAKHELTFKGQPIATETTDPLLVVMQRSKIVRDLVWEWVNHTAKTEGGLVAVGSNHEVVDLKHFSVFKFNPEASDITPENMAAVEGALFRQLAREEIWQKRLQSEQESIQVERSAFVWANNPLIAEFRAHAQEMVREVMHSVQEYGVTEFDLVTQVMMHLAAYEAEAVWLGNSALIHDIEELLIEEKGEEASQKFRAALEAGTIYLNQELARYECERQAQKLAQHYQQLHVELNGRTVRLPAEYMGHPDRNPFKDFPRTELSAKDRTYQVDPDTGEKIMIATEKFSGQKIIFKSVPPEISYLYSVGFSNLHYPRVGEVAVYGAYLEGDELPFAYTSYTPVVRKYSQDMLQYCGVNPADVMESARAWNCSWAPENTMSTLFAFAHEMLQERRMEEIKAGLSVHPLAGVFTSINPNLGFKAVSFRGVRFNVVGMKPTQFSYLRNEDGQPDFMPKGEIKKHLRVHDEAELSDHPDFLSNQVPFLPTLELLAVFDREIEAHVLEKPMYRVTPAAFQRG